MQQVADYSVRRSSSTIVSAVRSNNGLPAISWITQAHTKSTIAEAIGTVTGSAKPDPILVTNGLGSGIK